jgi:predicted Rossmann fold flavoprotein
MTDLADHNEQCDIAIIGGGAAGLAAAIFAAQANPSAKIIILDSAKSIGAKILVSGGGRCNVTHYRVSPKDYNGQSTFIKHVLAAFNEKQTRDWFDSLGVPLKREPTGKLFPVTNKARTILSALVQRCEKLNVQIKQQCRVSEISHLASQNTNVDASDSDREQLRHPFIISHSTCHNQSQNSDQAQLRVKRIIMATGGRSLPKTGSDGQGWSIVKKLGHTVTPTYPALAPLTLDDQFFHAALSGQAFVVELATFVKNKRIDQRTGSLLFTHFGISGPVVMDVSRHWIKAVAESNIDNTELRCNFILSETKTGKITPANFETIENTFLQQSNENPRKSVKIIVNHWLAKKLTDAILTHVNLDGDIPLSQLKRDDRRALAHALTAMRFPVLRDRGWNYAEVTAGGVPLNQVHHRNLQSRAVPGLYIIGEMLDCDGRIGGFNFQWAWATGHLAGKHAAQSTY